ncbi:ABC transporter permease [Rhizobium sp. AN83]|uniref:ABC transporter permease n=1 Tax=Rhizobium sp. AN83 TaxID=3035217 RepID=UPI002B262FD8|nr:ABC transporter permease [Rhizobium sp. AN83]
MAITTPENRQSPWRWLVVAVPYFWLMLFFAAPFFIIFKISLSDTAISMPPYTPVFEGFSKLGAFFSQAGFRKLPVSDGRPALHRRLSLVAAHRIHLHLPAVADRLSHGSCHGAFAVIHPPDAGDAGHPAVLDLVPDPRLRLDRYSEARRSADGAVPMARFSGPDQQVNIFRTETAIFIGIVYSYLPFMVLPLYSALEKFDNTLLEAAADLGCPPWKAFWKITFPLSLPGVVAGSMICFIPITGEFVIPDLLGGAQTLMIGKTLWTEFFGNRDWPLASAVAVLLLLLLVVPIAIFQNQQKKVG